MGAGSGEVLMKCVASIINPALNYLILKVEGVTVDGPELHDINLVDLQVGSEGENLLCLLLN